MPTGSVTAGHRMAGAVVLLAAALAVQVGVALAVGPEAGVYALPQIVAQQVPTPTPFRFQTPTPFVPRPATTTTSPTVSQTSPRAGGFPVELAFPILAGGLAAIGGGSWLLKRKGNK